MTGALSTSILVIGSDLHFCYLMQRYVRESNHPLLFASPDDKALELAQREKPSLIVLEDGLPEQKGDQLMRVIKSDAATACIPIALCSWHNDETRDPGDGADVYLRMPILYGDFLALLSRFGIL